MPLGKELGETDGESLGCSEGGNERSSHTCCRHCCPSVVLKPSKSRHMIPTRKSIPVGSRSPTMSSSMASIGRKISLTSK